MIILQKSEQVINEDESCLKSIIFQVNIITLGLHRAKTIFAKKKKKSDAK